MATTTTLSAILPKFGRRVGAYIGSFTTTTAIAANTSVVSTQLTDLGFTDDDVLNDSFIKITSGNNLNEVRLVSDYTASSGTITVTGTALTSDSSTQATFEIYRYDPDQLRDAINDAANQAFPALFKRIDDRTHTVAPGQARYERPSSIEPGYIRQVYIVPKIESKTFAENIINDQKIKDIKVRFQKVQDLPPKDLRKLVDSGKKELGDGIVIVFASSEDKVGLGVGVTEKLVDKYDAVKFAKLGSEIIGGKGGGGRKDFAQAGGQDKDKIDEAFEKLKSLI